MEQWLSLLIQIAIPVFKTLVYARTSNLLSELQIGIDTEREKQTQKMFDWMGIDNPFQETSQAIVPTKPEHPITSLVENASWVIQQTGLSLQQVGFEQQKALQQQLVAYQRETLFHLAGSQRETALKLPEVSKILENWPLRLFPSQLLETSPSTEILPLRIFFAPPQVQFESVDQFKNKLPEIELRLAQALREFLGKNYPLSSRVRPTEFIGGAWESKRFHSEASIKALFGFLKSEPTLILESEIEGDYLNFRMAYWGLGQKNYSYQTLLSFSYREFLYNSAKARAKQWKSIRDKLLAFGKTREEIERLGGTNYSNLTVLEEEELLESAGINPAHLALEYSIGNAECEDLLNFLTLCHCLVAGWVADIHHLTHSDSLPLLPELLPNLIQDSFKDSLMKSLIQTTVASYSTMLSSLAQKRPYWQPELALKLAQSLAKLPDKSWAKQQIKASLSLWLQQRQIETTEEPWRQIESVLTVNDQEYFEQLHTCLIAIADSEDVAKVEEILAAIATLKRDRHIANVTLAQTITGFQNSIAAIALTSSPSEMESNFPLLPPSGNFSYSPEHQQLLVSAGDDKIIKLWQLESLPPLESTPTRILNSHAGKILTLTLSPNGETLATVDQTDERSFIKLWDIRTGQLLRTLFGHRKPIQALAISGDGNTIASGSHKIKLWDLSTGNPLRMLYGHRHSVSCIAISDKAEMVVSGGEDSTIKVWDVNNEALCYTLSDHKDGITTVILHPNGEILISSSRDGCIKLWELNTGRLLNSLTGHIGAVHGIALSTDGQYLVSGGADKTIKIWDVLTGECLQTLTGHSDAVCAIALSVDGHTISSGSWDKTIKIWRV
ncbi:MAG: WD40 repeat domain-containing protein [Chroococcales cyanobacterium]